MLELLELIVLKIKESLGLGDGVLELVLSCEVCLCGSSRGFEDVLSTTGDIQSWSPCLKLSLRQANELRLLSTKASSATSYSIGLR